MSSFFCNSHSHRFRLGNVDCRVAFNRLELPRARTSSSLPTLSSTSSTLPSPLTSSSSSLSSSLELSSSTFFRRIGTRIGFRRGAAFWRTRQTRFFRTISFKFFDDEGLNWKTSWLSSSESSTSSTSSSSSSSSRSTTNFLLGALVRPPRPLDVGEAFLGPRVE